MEDIELLQADLDSQAFKPAVFSIPIKVEADQDLSTGRLWQVKPLNCIPQLQLMHFELISVLLPKVCMIRICHQVCN